MVVPGQRILFLNSANKALDQKLACAGTNNGLEKLMKNCNCISKSSVKIGTDRHPVTVAKNKKSTTKRWKKNTTYIATWTVRTLFQKSKLDNVVMEMNRMKLKILGSAEMRWNGTGSFKKDGHTILYSGNNERTMELVSLCTAV